MCANHRKKGKCVSKLVALRWDWLRDISGATIGPNLEFNCCPATCPKLMANFQAKVGPTFSSVGSDNPLSLQAAIINCVT